LGQASLLAQETAELFQGHAAHVGPLVAEALGLDVVQGFFQACPERSRGVGVEVDFGMGLEVEAQGVAGDGHVEVVGLLFAGAAAEQPLAVALQ
jgi:hypothetical protein